MLPRLLVGLAAIRLAVGAVFNNGTWKLLYPPWDETASPMYGKPELFIPIMGPITGHSCMPNRYVAMRIATSHLNRRDPTFCPAIAQLQHDFEVKYDLRDSHATGSGTVLAAMKLMEADTQAGRTVGNANARVKVVLGPNSSPEAAGVYPFLGGAFSIPYLSWAATSGSLGNKDAYPYFFRVVAPDSVTMGVQAGYIHWLGYRRVIILHMEDGYATGQANDFISAATATYGLQVEKSSIPQSGGGAGSSLSAAARTQALAALEWAKKTNVRIIGLYGINMEIRDVFLLADQLNMARGPGWLWFGGDGMAGTMFTGDAVADAQLLQLMEGTIYAMADNPSPYWSPFQTAWRAYAPSMDEPEFTVQDVCHGGTVCQNRSDFAGMDRTGTRCLNSWLQEAYVAMVSMAVVADRLMTSTGKVPSDFTKEDWYVGLKTLITNPFTCLSGHMQLSARQERASDVSFFQLQVGLASSAVAVSKWQASAGYGWMPNVPLKWADGTGYTPVARDDNVTVPSGRPPTCPVGEAYNQDTLRCEACPQGYTALTFDGVAVCTCDLGYGMVGGICLPCSPGTAKAQSGGQTCSACEPGKVSVGSGATSCQPCGWGTFSSQPGQAACTACGQGYTTAAPGAQNRSDCICAEDYYMQQGQCIRCASGAMTSGSGKTSAVECLCPKGEYRPKGEPELCKACKVGMICETEVDRRIFGSVEKGGPTPSNYSMEPRLEPSFWSGSTDTLKVYRCSNAKRCPGGLPGASCARKLQGRSCHHCIEGWVWNGDECVQCSGVESLMYLLPMAFGPLIVVVLYKLFGDGYGRWNSAGNGCAAVVFIMLNHCQIVTTLRGADVAFPADVLSWWSLIAYVSDAARFLNIECARSSRFLDVLVTNAIGPAFVIILFGVMWVLSNLLGRLINKPEMKMEINRTLNCCFSVLFTFFPAIVESSFTLFTCGLNTAENTDTSLIRDRSVICFSEEWNGMLGIGLVSILVWVCGFGGLLVRTVICAPRWFHDTNAQMRWKFLFIKYRSDVHWWALMWIFKGIMINLGFTFLRVGIAQVYWVMVCDLLYTCAAVVFMPWRHIFVNYNDIWAHLCVLCLCAALTWFANRLQQDLAALDGDMSRIIIAFNLMTTPIALSIMALLWYNDLSRTRKAEKLQACWQLRVSLAAAALSTEEAFDKFLQTLGEWDFYFLMNAKSILLQEYMGFKVRRGISVNELQKCATTEEMERKSVGSHGQRISIASRKSDGFASEPDQQQQKQHDGRIEDGLPPKEDIPSCFRSRVLRGVAAVDHLP